MKKTLSLLALAGIGGYAFMNQVKFGKRPKGEGLYRIKNSPNYRNGQFKNLSETPSFTEGANYFTVMKKFFFEKDERVEPATPIPSMKTDLKTLSQSEEVLVWFGHSSYFIQSGGKRFLVDPVLNGSASPLSFTNKAFEGTDPYAAEDIPEIDYLFLTHDHWDHLDYDTIKELQPKIHKVITGLGTGGHLESWGYDPKIITELDWNQEYQMEAGFSVHTVPARHFSGRGLKRNGVLWISFALKTPTLKIFIGGDSGYDTHFAEAGKQHGPFDLAILENGQYNRHWKYIHMMPEETVQAAKDLRAKKLLPVHNSKFALSTHSWDAPLRTITGRQKEGGPVIMTPMIGEKADLNNENQKFSKWWEGVR